MQHQRYFIACEQVKWKFQCPQHWQDLSKTDKESIRYCSDCRRNVHLAHSASELNDLARQGACVAWPGNPDDEAEKQGYMVIGEVDGGSPFSLENAK
ncbi:hypothetical protein [Microbulbifer hydrolyticus]|uniref:Uncharacterized protein n=1 Tax=Microbulbifer hydrolyticus TaxID=48074 RepID=A0A6P1T4E1_9GAMM|nr:hypothetical protein [Microbulbifer hydrolyticus]MBB5211485.1 hypothetical protein [Microbulbifer hydrolyticus]QHQ37764.1 hypothetical protein GTQ55_01355 [Microbulbifer hydrolyticus]